MRTSEKPQNKSAIVPDHLLMAKSACFWAEAIKLRFGGSEFSRYGHLYQQAMLNETPKYEVYKFGTQQGKTIVQMIKTLHHLIYRKYPQGVMYVFPTVHTVRRFSQSRFTPLLADNPAIGRHISDTDNIELKRVGKANLYMTGARVGSKIEGIRKTSTLLKSEPVDRMVFDEYDEMDPDMVDIALHRMDHSRFQEWAKISTPSIPDYQIDREYQESDQRVWMIKCQHCGHRTCLELEFPECLMETDEGVKRVCIRCRQEIYSCDGTWIAQYPDREVVGRWISQLNSDYIDPGRILRAYYDPPNGNIADVYNHMLGMAYIAAENRLTPQDVFGLCTQNPAPLRHSGPCAMGVDVGNELHYVIGYRPTKFGLAVAKYGRCERFDTIRDMIREYNVRTVVIDALPEKRKVAEFIEALGDTRCEGFACLYDHNQRLNSARDSKYHTVKINRTDICDATHNLVTVPGRLTLPRRSDETETFITQMCNVAKVQIVSDDEADPSGRPKNPEYVYKKLGPDHYRHAMNYFLLAAETLAVAPAEARKRRIKDAWDDDDQRYPRAGSFMGV